MLDLVLQVRRGFAELSKAQIEPEYWAVTSKPPVLSTARRLLFIKVALSLLLGVRPKVGIQEVAFGALVREMVSWGRLGTGDFGTVMSGNSVR